MLIDRGDLVAAGDGRYEMRTQTRAPGGAGDAACADRGAARRSRRADRRLIQSAAIVGQSFTGRRARRRRRRTGRERPRPAGRAGRAAAAHASKSTLALRSVANTSSYSRVVKEVAEGSLSRADRRTLHVAAARYYESLGRRRAGRGAGQPLWRGVSSELTRAGSGRARGTGARIAPWGRGTGRFSAFLQAGAGVPRAGTGGYDRPRGDGVPARAGGTYGDQQWAVDVAMGHAKAVETLSRDAGDSLGVLRGVTSQAIVHMSLARRTPRDRAAPSGPRGRRGLGADARDRVLPRRSSGGR